MTHNTVFRCTCLFCGGHGYGRGGIFFVDAESKPPARVTLHLTDKTRYRISVSQQWLPTIPIRDSYRY